MGPWQEYPNISRGSSYITVQYNKILHTAQQKGKVSVVLQLQKETQYISEICGVYLSSWEKTNGREISEAQFSQRHAVHNPSPPSFRTRGFFLRT